MTMWIGFACERTWVGVKATRSITRRSVAGTPVAGTETSPFASRIAPAFRRLRTDL
jgi:hypothetical protein